MSNMRNTRRFSRDKRANLAHAMMHLDANKIADASAYGGWYCGNKEQFIKRHVKAVAFVRSLLTPNAEVSDGGPLTPKPKQANSRRSLH